MWGMGYFSKSLNLRVLYEVNWHNSSQPKKFTIDRGAIIDNTDKNVVLLVFWKLSNHFQKYKDKWFQS